MFDSAGHPIFLLSFYTNTMSGADSGIERNDWTTAWLESGNLMCIERAYFDQSTLNAQGWCQSKESNRCK